MDLGLTDKVALVTGSYRGTGAGIARALAAEGAVVLVHGHEGGQADEVASAIGTDGGRAHVVVGDIRTEDGTAALVSDVRARVDGVDIVVNNFGNTEHASDWDAADTSSWHSSYDINVVSGWTDWTEWAAGLEAASPGITAQARPVPTPAEAFTTWPLLTRPELEILCGPGHELPPGVVRHEWAGGEAWLVAAALPT